MFSLNAEFAILIKWTFFLWSLFGIVAEKKWMMFGGNNRLQHHIVNTLSD